MEVIQNARLRIIPGAARSVIVVLDHSCTEPYSNGGSQVHPQSRAYTQLTASPNVPYHATVCNLCVAGSVQLSV